MFQNERPVWAEVHLDRLEFNYNSIKNLARGKRILAVVKADGYGHGMKQVATKIKSMGIADFAVAILDEALEFRGFDKESSILVLGFTTGESAAQAVANDVTITVFRYSEAKKFSDEAVRQGKRIKLSVALDTGMSRIGFPCNEASVAEIHEIAELPNVVMEEIYSHFSTADDADKTYSQLQLQRYNAMVDQLTAKGVKFSHYHMANSAAIIDLPEAHFDTVRPGIVQYGYQPSDEVHKERLPLKPILDWKAKLVLVKTIKQGTPVSYGNTFVAQKDTVIGTIPLGYADGYSRGLSSKGAVLYKGKLCPIAGRVCMDQMMVDLTGVENPTEGDDVILLGSDGNIKYDADDMARVLNTISYEITCCIGKRVPRKYFDPDQGKLNREN